MKLYKRTDEELSSFIHFGGLMTAELRRATARVLVRYLYDPNFDPLPQLEKLELPGRYPSWWPSIRQFFQQDKLRLLTSHNEELSLSVARNVLNWCRRTYQRMNVHNEHGEEERSYLRWRERGQKEPARRWRELVKELAASYPRLNQNWEFYLQRLQEDSASSLPGSEAQALEVLHHKVLSDWGKQLRAKKQQYEIRFLEEAANAYFHELKKKYGRLNLLGDLISPYYKYLGRLWNASFDDWNRVPWDKIEAYVKLLREDPRLQELADLLGRWQMAELDWEEERLEQFEPKHKWKPNPYGKSEVIGIHHSDDLSAVLPSEIALLSHPETEIILSKKYVEKKLLSFQYRSQDLESDPDLKEVPTPKPKIEEKGPIILVIDTSGSMFGQPELVAKAVAFFLVGQALRENRKCYLISFSTHIQTRELTRLNETLDNLVDFLSLSFHGNTDILPALNEALSMLKKRSYTKADVLVVSDFILPQMGRKLVEKVMEQRRDKGTQFHCLYITRRIRPEDIPASLFDHFWVYDMAEPQIIRQTLEQLERMASRK